MIVAQDKTCSYGLSYEQPQPKPKKMRRLKRSSSSRKFLLLVLILFSFSLGAMITYFQARVYALGYEICCLQQELTALRVENHDLDERVQQMASLERVEMLAINKLGMVKPDSTNVLVLSVDSKAQSFDEVDANTVFDGEPLAGDGESLLLKAFNEFVNRLESKTGRDPDSGTSSEGVTYADNKSSYSEKNNLSFSGCGGTLSGFSIAVGLVATC
ncbi:MAG: hypothetical protein ACOX0T_03705 [Pelotomaculum sp.]|jgi:cell division protein FtsL